MKKLMMALVAGVAGLVLGGCASIQTAQQFNDQKTAVGLGVDPVAHVNGSNWGFYLLSIPLVAGSTDKVGEMEFFGADTVRVEPVVNIVTAKSKELGATKTLDLVSSASSTMMPFPFPFLFYIKQVEVSGNAVK